MNNIHFTSWLAKPITDFQAAAVIQELCTDKTALLSIYKHAQHDWKRYCDDPHTEDPRLMHDNNHIWKTGIIEVIAFCEEQLNERSYFSPII